jgi:hypothetical protein
MFTGGLGTGPLRIRKDFHLLSPLCGLHSCTLMLSNQSSNQGSSFKTQLSLTSYLLTSEKGTTLSSCSPVLCSCPVWSLLSSIAYAPDCLQLILLSLCSMLQEGWVCPVGGTAGRLQGRRKEAWLFLLSVLDSTFSSEHDSSMPLAPCSPTRIP